MSHPPRVSVVIPVYNGERYVAEALASVLTQTYPPFEVIVADDGSTDRSGEIAQSFGPPVRYDYQPHRPAGGAAAARNRGAELAQGELLAFLDADDVWLVDKLERQVKSIQTGLADTMVFGHMREFVSPDVDEETRRTFQCHNEPVPGLTPCTLLISRSTFLDSGLFDPSWGVGEFIDWYLRCAERGMRTVMLPEVVALRRLHRTNQGVLKRDLRGDYVRIVKAALDRRRRGGAAPTTARPTE